MAERNSHSSMFPMLEVHYQRNLCRVKKGYMGAGYLQYGGYKKEILKENLTEREKVFIICKICEGIMREAIILSDGRQICSGCDWRVRCITDSKQIPNKAVRETVSSLKCCCPLMERGCEWLGTLRDCEDHLDTCGYVRDQCKLGCGEVLQRNELKLHQQEDCSNREVRCEHCDMMLIHRYLSTHLDECPKIEVSCELCHEVMCREDMVQHLAEDCVEKEIECPFAKYKCEVTSIKRKHLSQHLEEKRTEHLELKLNAMELKLTEMEELVMKQNETIEKLNSKLP